LEDNIKWIVKKYSMSVWTGFKWFRWGPMSCCCEHGNEHVQVNAEKTKYVVTSCHQNTGEKKSRNLMIANTFFENMAKFRYCKLQ